MASSAGSGRRVRTISVPAAPSPATTAAAGTTGSGKLSLQGDILRMTVIGLLIITISRIHQHFGILATLRVGLLLTLLTATIAYLNPKLLRPGSMLDSWPAKLMAALGIMACISVPFGISMGASGKFIIESYSKVLIGAFILIVSIRNTSDLYTLVVGAVLGGAVLAFFALFVFQTEATGSDGFARLSHGYSFDANDLATMSVTVMGLSLWLAVTRTGWMRIFAIVTSLGLAATVARSGSRGGFIGLLAVGVALLLLARTVPVWKRMAMVVLAIVGLFLAAPPGYWEQMQTISSPKDDYNWSAPSGRRPLWKRGMGYMVTHPLTGIGIANFPKAEETISPLIKNWHPGMPGIKSSAAHNSFVEVGAEMGLPGLALFSALILGGIGGMYRLGRRLPRSWRHGTEEQRFLAQGPTYLLVALAGFASAGFFVSFAYWDIPYVIAALMAGLYVCLGDQLGLPASSTAGSRGTGGRAAARRG